MIILEIKYLNNSILDSEMEYIKKTIPKKYESSLSYKSKEARNLSLLSKIMICNNLNISEDDIKFNKLKKPYIENGPYFNVSHSKDLVVFVKSDNQIGIDIEYVNKKNLSIINYAFNNKEQDYILNASDNLTNAERLTKYWTIKESVFKASGSDKYIEPKDIIVNDVNKLDFLGINYYIYTFKHFGAFLTVASIDKYDDFLIVKDTIIR